jgi:hypothetical protein
MFGDPAGNMIGIFGRTPTDRLRSPLTVQRPRDHPHAVRPFREEAFMHDEDDLAARVAPVRKGGDEAS